MNPRKTIWITRRRLRRSYFRRDELLNQIRQKEAEIQQLHEAVNNAKTAGAEQHGGSRS